MGASSRRSLITVDLLAKKIEASRFAFARLRIMRARRLPALGLHGIGCLVPENLPLTEVRLVGHVAGDGRVISKDSVLQHWLACLDGLEEVPKVRPNIIP